MMQSEFETLIGHDITAEEYKKVETVYMAWEYKEMSKEKIADLYKHDKEFVTDTLYSYIVNQNGRYNARVGECKNLRELLSVTEEAVKSGEKLAGTMEKYIHILETRNEELKQTGLHYLAQVSKLETQNEELETQLHQYKTLFADIEKNMTVNLYSTLLGVAE